MAFNRKQKLRDNIEAIRTAFILDRENRTATTEERAILQRYCGFDLRDHHHALADAEACAWIARLIL